MNVDQNERLVFAAEWFQQEANLNRSFLIFYFPADKTVEIFDHKTKKTFLKRTRIPNDNNFSEQTFYIGAKINIFGRQFNIVNYADTYTAQKLKNLRENTFCLIKPDGIKYVGEIVKRFEMENFIICNCLMVKLRTNDALQFCATSDADEQMLSIALDHLTSDFVIGFELISNGVVGKLNEIAGPDDSIIAKELHPNSLRAKFGENDVKNVLYFSKTIDDAKNDLQFFFPKNRNLSKFQTSAMFDGTSLGVIKPHAIKEQKLGEILAYINDGGFTITAMNMIHLDRGQCEEFYEVYKGVVKEYVQMVLELCSGHCLAIEVLAKDFNTESKQFTFNEFRKLCGPMDAELAKKLRPNTIRAKFGHNIIQNAIHCTDLEDGTLDEINFFFY